MGPGRCDRGRALAAVLEGTSWGSAPFGLRCWYIPRLRYLAVVEFPWAFSLALHVHDRRVAGLPASLYPPRGPRTHSMDHLRREPATSAASRRNWHWLRAGSRTNSVHDDSHLVRS